MSRHIPAWGAVLALPCKPLTFAYDHQLPLGDWRIVDTVTGWTVQRTVYPGMHRFYPLTADKGDWKTWPTYGECLAAVMTEDPRDGWQFTFDWPHWGATR